MTDISEAFHRIESELANYSGENEILREELASIRSMMDRDEQGWIALSSVGNSAPGMSLSQLKGASKQAREMAVGNPLVKRGLELRFSYVWSKGVQIPGINEETGKRGAPTKLEKFYRNPINQDNVFSDAAHQAMEFSAGTDGCYLLLGNDKDKTLRAIPLAEIAAVYVNPEFSGEVWAILREWTPNPNSVTTRRRWYYSDQFTGTRRKTIQDEVGTSVPVEPGYTLIDFWANRQVGWALGIPDSLPAIPWARGYTELMMMGKTLTEALSRFASKIKVGSKAGANNVGVKLGNGGPGQAAVLGEGNEMDIFASAGKTFQFEGVQAWAAMAATALEVSVIHLLSSPGAAGSSYGAASNLDLPTKRAMVARQNVWKAYLERVIRWATDTDVSLSFPPLDDDPYRTIQSHVLLWNTGLYEADEIRGGLADALGVSLKHESAPKGVLLPNNEESLARRDIDADEVGTTAASPDQGQSGTVPGTAADSSAKNDQRTDSIGESLRSMQIEDLLGRVTELVHSLENKQ